MQTSFVQLGAGYAASEAAGETVASARRLVHALASPSPDSGFCVLGASSSSLFHVVSLAVEPSIEPGDQIVVASSGHEANIGPWVRLAQRRGAELVWWHPEGEHGEDACPATGLARLLDAAGGRAKVVAFSLVSNLLGGVADCAAVSRLARAAGAVSVCDAVAYAPHRCLDAPALAVDFIGWSLYKTFGPHAAALYGSHAAWAGLRGRGAVPPNHFFVSEGSGGVVSGPTAAPWAPWELGGAPHEACAALCGTRRFLAALADEAAGGGGGAGAPDGGGDDRPVVEAAFRALRRAEAPVQAALLSYLSAQHAAGRLRLLGPREAAAPPAADADSARVPTFSFVPTRASVASVVAACHSARVAVRSGHMYAYRLCERLGVDTATGVVRVSALGYNTVDEAARCIAAIDAAL